MPYYCVKQHDITDCGAACLATVSKQYGLKVPVSRIREVAGTDKKGTNMNGLVKAAEQLGFSAKGVKGDQKALFSDFPLPAIAHVIIDGNLLHYVVIHKITKNKIVVADPARGVVNYKPEDFFNIWTGVLLILIPNTTFEKGNEKKGTLTNFFSLLIPQKKLLFQIFLASLLITVLGIAASFYFRFIMDEVVVNGLERSLTVISIGVVALYLFKSILEYFRCHLLLYLSQRIDIPLILGYYKHVLLLPMSFFGTRRIGEIVSRFTDASKIRDAISNATLTIMIDTLMTLVGAVVLYLQNRMSHANAFIEKLPARYDTLLEENGANLSGGQRQRLAIARALLKKPDILIMDEATSNLDSITENAIKNTIEGLPEAITTIIIAHRLSTIMRCDEIFVMSEGRIVENGNHNHLMSQKGIYYNLWSQQISDDLKEEKL